MSAMLEKVARAIREADLDAAGPNAYYPEWEVRLARAALMAMREPTDGVIMAGICERHKTNVPEAWSLATANIYKAMIDAILNEPPCPDAPGGVASSDG